MAKEIEEVKDIFDLTNKVAVVTGGYGHLGSAMTMALLDKNATVVVAGRTREKFEEKFSSVHNSRLFFRTIDISDSKSIHNRFNQIKTDFGSLDVLFNNAHYAKGNVLQGVSDEDWAYTLDGVLGSVYKCIREVMPIMVKQGNGKIINIASMYGIVSPDFSMYKGKNCEKYTNPPHYGSAKAGVIQLTKYYAVELGGKGIQVNAITPGPFPNYTVQEENPEFINRLKNKNPLNKIGKPEDLAGISILLSSSASDFITGQNFVVDGGWTIW